MSHRILRRVLFLGIMVLVVAGFCVEFADDVLELEDIDVWLEFFSLSYERNLPTWYATCQLFLAAVLLCCIAIGVRQAQAGYVAHWWVLTGTFLYISLDEFVSIHENMGRWFNFSGVLYFGWVIPAAVIVTVFGLSYVRFLTALPATSRKGFMLAGSVYVMGALGMELPLGYWTDRFGSHNFGYACIDLVEEGLELLGISLFILALVGHLSRQSGRVEVTVAMDPIPVDKTTRPRRDPGL